MFINVNVCFLVSIETHMLAANLEATALRIGCVKQKFHELVETGVGYWSKSWQLFFSLTQIIVM
jgi:hypothetical protein